MANIETRLVLFHNLFLICLAGAIIMLIVAAIIFVRLHIVQVIGYITGTQAKREISRIRLGGTEERRKAPVSEKKEVQIQKVASSEIPVITITQKLENGQEQVSVLNKTGDATVMLDQQPVSFYIEREIIFIHTDEIVE